LVFAIFVAYRVLIRYEMTDKERQFTRLVISAALLDHYLVKRQLKA